MNPPPPRFLLLHWGTYFQRIKFFPGCCREELLAGIREVMGVAADSPLRFRDAEGDIVLLCSAMPSGTVLHAAVEHGAPFQGVTASIAPVAPVLGEVTEWRCWAKAEGGSIDENGMVFQKSSNHSDTTSMKFCAYTHPLPQAGQHYFVVDFKEKPCCVSVGLVPATLASVPSNLWLMKEPGYPFMVALQAVGTDKDPVTSCTSGSPGLAVGVYLDMDSRMLVLVSHEDPQNPALAICMDGIGPGPWVFVVSGPKHDMLATIRRCDLPAGGVHIAEPAQRFNKPAALQRSSAAEAGRQ